MRIAPILLAVLVSLLQPAATAAQALTGSLSGTVRYDSPVLGNIFLDPRRVMLSVKVNLGK